MAKHINDDVVPILIREGKIKVSEDGQVYNCKTHKYFTPGKPEENKIFSLRYDGETYAVSKSRILWLAFKGPVPTGHVVGIDDPTKAITLENIRLKTPKEVSYNNIINGNKQVGELCHFAKFTNDQVLALRREYAAKPFPLRPRAKELGTDHNTLSHLISGDTYKQVPEACPVINKFRRTGAKDSPEERERVRERRRLNAKKNRDLRKENAPVRKPVLQTRPTPEVYHDRRKLEREATELLKQDRAASRPVKPKPEPKPKIAKKRETTLIKAPEVIIEDNDLPGKVEQYSPAQDHAAREKLRLQKEAHRERIEADRLQKQIEDAAKEREAKKRIDMIRRIAEKRQGQASSNLTPFKQFAVYHLHTKLGESLESIAKVIRVEDQTLVELALKAFKPEAYETTRNELIEKYGRDSVMLNSIRLFEGDFNHE